MPAKRRVNFNPLVKTGGIIAKSSESSKFSLVLATHILVACQNFHGSSF